MLKVKFKHILAFALVTILGLGANAEIRSVEKRFDLATKTSISDYVGKNSKKVKKAPSADSSSDWNNIGTGTWVDGLMSFFSDDFPTTPTWEVPIEESASTPGLYRIQPYNVPDNPVYKVIGLYDDGFIIVDATNPDKVNIYDEAEENNRLIIVFDALAFGLVNPENGWDIESGYYGTLNNGIISFDPFTFAFNNNGMWGYISGEVKLGLPGVHIDDYSLQVSAPYCAENNEIKVNLKAGADLSSVKYLLAEGYLIYDQAILATAFKDGVEIDPTVTEFTVVPESNGVYTLVVLSIKDGIRQDAKALAVYGVYDDEENWEDIGDGLMHDGILSTTSLFNIVEQDIVVKFQEHKDKKGYYRVVNPYANQSLIQGLSSFTHDGHNHYIYIDATKPERVILEPSPLGMSIDGYGETAIWSSYEYYKKNYDWLFDEEEMEAFLKEYCGTLKGYKISFPDESILFGMHDVTGSSFYEVGENFSFTLPGGAGFEGVNVDNTSESSKYYNLQGMPVKHLDSGNIYIEKRGESARKFRAN